MYFDYLPPLMYSLTLFTSLSTLISYTNQFLYMFLTLVLYVLFSLTGNLCVLKSLK